MTSTALDLFPVDVVFDSAVADGTSITDLDNPTFSLMPSIENCVGISLISAQVPFSYFVVDYTNNQFDITIANYNPTPNYTGAKYTVSLLPGTYTSNNIIPMLTYAIRANTVVTVGSGGGGTNTDLYTVFDMRFLIDDSTSSLLMYFNNLGGTSGPGAGGSEFFQISFPTLTSLAPVIGFTNYPIKKSAIGAIYDNSDTQIGASSLHYIYSPFAINLSGPSYLFLHSEKLAGICPGAVRNSTTSTDIIASIPVNNNYQGTIEYLNPIAQRIPFTKSNLPSKIDFRWTLGSRTTFDIDNGVRTNYLKLLGQPFLIVMRFYIASATTQIENMNRFGDKFTESQSQNTGAKRPNETVFRSGNTGRLKPNRRRDPSNGKPMPNPSSSIATPPLRLFF